MKTIPTLFLLLFSALSFGQNLTDHLYAYFPFHGNANDVIGKNIATVTGATLTSDRFGTPNSAYKFTGTANSIFVKGMYNANQFKNGYAVSFWMKQPVLPKSFVFFKSQFFIFCVENETGFWKHNITSFNNLNDSTYKWNGGKWLIDDVWHNVVASCNGTTATVYIDGVLAKTYPSNMLTDSTNNGGYLVIGDDGVTGEIDDVRIYSRVLTQADATALYSDNTGIEQPIIPNISIYPNPAHSFLFVSEPCQVSIYSMTGQLVKLSLNSQQIDVSVLNGLYIVECRNREGVKVEKLYIL